MDSHLEIQTQYHVSQLVAQNKELGIETSAVNKAWPHQSVRSILSRLKILSNSAMTEIYDSTHLAHMLTTVSIAVSCKAIYSLFHSLSHMSKALSVYLCCHSSLHSADTHLEAHGRRGDELYKAGKPSFSRRNHAQSCMTATIHPAQVSFSENTEFLPSQLF